MLYSTCMTLHEIDTPALLVDLDAMERNLAKMARFFSGSTKLRPHYKNHKCPALAHRQMDAGAIGMTCATLSEAETLVSNGITNVLISSELAGDRKIARFIELARQADVKAVVDNPKAIASLGAACRAKQCRAGVLVNVNVGQNRTGAAAGRTRAGAGPQSSRGRPRIPRPHGLRRSRGASGGRAGKGIRLRPRHERFDAVPLPAGGERHSRGDRQHRRLRHASFDAAVSLLSPSFKPARTC